MRVDVIVLDIDGPALLDACVASLQAQTVPARIILFDNGSRVPLRGRLGAWRDVPYDGLTFLRSETNLGFTGGVNEAFRHVDAEFVALVNNDAVVEPDWLATLLEAMARDPKLAAVQTIIRRDERTIDGAVIDISDGTFRQIGSGMPLGPALPEAWGVSATAALYRVAALGDRVFEPRFFTYYEDVELCARLHEQGWATRVLPVVKATHSGSQSASVLGRRALRLRTRNRYLVAELHPGIGDRRALLREDLKLLLRGRASLRGMIDGLF
jgi:GT2 family glycosyltransferase